MRKLFLDIQIYQGDAIPHWYGVAYYDFARDTAVCYPFGVHLLVRWARSVYWWLVWKRPSRVESELMKAYKYGREYANDEAYEAGYRQGLQDGREASLEQLLDGYDSYR